MSKNKTPKPSVDQLQPHFSGIAINRDGEYIAITRGGQLFWIHPNSQGERVWTLVADYNSDEVQDLSK